MDKILEIVKTLISSGRTKMLVAGGGIYAVYQMAVTDKVGGQWAVVIIGVIAVAYFVARHIERINETKNGGN